MNTQVLSKWASEIQRRRAAILNYLLMAGVIGGAVTLVLISRPEGLPNWVWWTRIALYLLCWSIVLITWLWRNLGYRVRAWVLLSITYTVGLVVFWRTG
ncbi:MAG: hypothetical protein PVH62_09110, partial [Anaerolineae bacterium]